MLKKYYPLALSLVALLNLFGCGGSAPTKSSAGMSTMDDLFGTKVIVQDIAPDRIPAGTKNVKLARIVIASAEPDVNWSRLKLELIGSANDTDVNAIKVFLDNGDGTLDPMTDQVIGQDVFQSGTSQVTINNLPLAEQPKICFVTADLKQTAVAGQTLGVRITSEDFFTVSDSFGVLSTDLPFSSRKMVFNPTSSVPTTPTTPTTPATPFLPLTLPTVPKPSAPAVVLVKPELPDTLDSPIGVMEKLEQEKTIKMQEKEFMAQKYYETGLKLYKQSQYQQAKDNIQKSLELNPQHKGAQELLRKIHYLLGDRSAEIQTVKDFLENQLRIKIQAVEKEINNHFLKGERYLSDNEYRKALKEFETVEEKLRWMPYDIGLSEYRTKARQRIKKVKARQAKHESVLVQQQRRAAEELARKEEEKRQQELVQKIKRLFNEAILNFQQTNYEDAERLADKILRLAPTFRPAQELKEDSIRARHKKTWKDYVELKVENWKRIIDDIDVSTIPFAEDQLIRYDRRIWEEVKKRKPPGLTATEIAEDPDILDIKRKLESIKHPFNLDGSNTLYEVIDYLQQTYKIPIQFDAEVNNSRVPQEKRSLNVRGLPLSAGLQHLLNQYDLTYIFKNKSLWIVQSASNTADLQIRVYGIDNIVRQAPDFAGPSMELPTASGGPGWQAPPVDTIAKPTPDIEKLIEMIQNHTVQSNWEIEGASIEQIGESNRLIVINTPEIQRKVAEFLQTMRSFSGSMIAVDSIFLAVTDDFLEDVGFAWRDLTDAPNNVDPSNATLPAPNPAGFTSNPGGARDQRFRSAYSFLNPNNFSQFAPGVRLTNSGGIGLQYSILGNTQINILFRALEKTGKGTVLDAPKLVVFNAQRAHVAYLRQQTYIQDLEVVSGAVAYDTVLATFQTGVVLDVKPVMSYDRKYITLHIFTTLASLIDLQNFSITAGRGVDDDELSLQLPWIQLQRVRSSIMVPDRGTLLLGGMKNVVDQDVSLSTPFLSNIPIIGMFFRRRAKTKEKQNMMIMIKAEILELSELEKEVE